MKKQLAVVVLSFMFVLAAAVGMADAENRKGAVSFSPHLGGYVFEGNQNINSDPVYGVGLGYNITERFGLEGVFDWVDTDSRTSSKEPDVEAMIYRLDALYHFMPESSFVPYVSLGGGAININKDPGESDTDALVNYGGGFKYFVTDSFAVRADVRHIIAVENDVYNNLIYTLGLNVLFGGQEDPGHAGLLRSLGSCVESSE